MDLKQFVREVPDFPEPGIRFRDITTVLKNPEALTASMTAMADLIADAAFDLILGTESRGFIFGMPMACRLGKGFVPVRKAGKLPAPVVSQSYALEYGRATVEMHRDAIAPGQRVLIVDDLLATGGTARATAQLAETIGATVAAFCFFIELADLGGRDVLTGYDVRSVLNYREMV